MKRRTFLIGVFGAFASLTTGTLPQPQQGNPGERSPLEPVRTGRGK